MELGRCACITALLQLDDCLSCSTGNTNVNFDPSNPSFDPLPRSDMNLCQSLSSVRSVARQALLPNHTEVAFWKEVSTPKLVSESGFSLGYVNCLASIGPCALWIRTLIDILFFEVINCLLSKVSCGSKCESKQNY